MEIPGRVQNGVVVLEGAPALPEGAKVTVSYHGPTDAGLQSGKQRIEVPLVRTGEPGTVNLTGQRIAEILDEEDGSPRCWSQQQSFFPHVWNDTYLAAFALSAGLEVVTFDKAFTQYQGAKCLILP